MKKVSKKLSLSTHTVRVLSGAELEAAAGGGAAINATTIVRHHTVRANAATPCLGHTIMKVPPPAVAKL